MCIIAAKPAGTPMPSNDRLRTMWDGNRDGAGFMYVENGAVKIEKGFMKYKTFITALEKVSSRLDLTATPVVMHFRITTHGGTKPENTHPFPITDNVGALQKLKASCDIGVAHNGIIPISPRKGISDTMEYVATQLAPLKRALPRFYENKHAMLLISNAIQSRMAFLTAKGKIFTVGNFIEDEGILYSNDSYLGRKRSFSYGCYGGWYDDEYETYGLGDKLSTSTGGKYVPPFAADNEELLMWLRDGDYVTDEEGHLLDGDCYLINEHGRVYYYEYRDDVAIPCPGFTARTPEGLLLRFNDEEAMLVYVGC